MKVLKIKTHEKLEAYRKEGCGKCKVVMQQGYYEVTCDKCTSKKVAKKAKEELVKDIDTDGNGHITHSEVETYFNKKDDK